MNYIFTQVMFYKWNGSYYFMNVKECFKSVIKICNYDLITVPPAIYLTHLFGKLQQSMAIIANQCVLHSNQCTMMELQNVFKLFK